VPSENPKPRKFYWEDMTWEGMYAPSTDGGLTIRQRDVMGLAIALATLTRMRFKDTELRFSAIYRGTDHDLSRILRTLQDQLAAIARYGTCAKK